MGIFGALTTAVTGMRARHSRTFANCRYESGEPKSKYQWASIGVESTRQKRH